MPNSAARYCGINSTILELHDDTGLTLSGITQTELTLDEVESLFNRMVSVKAGLQTRKRCRRMHTYLRGC